MIKIKRSQLFHEFQLPLKRTRALVIGRDIGWLDKTLL
jgi:hypothetical protein